jgi:hypothetical protein
MNTKDDGGPVFPHTEFQASTPQEPGLFRQFQGMTLRDYFASAAMGCITGSFNATDAARYAYELADTMLEARKA